uniref:Uncharacterized protein n=1 Tax=Mycena chlorophos TaxID=658473 RepID=A0ABQ0LJ44_MYCCL|nr:predicted protein [Mycena chlorophos]
MNAIDSGQRQPDGLSGIGTVLGCCGRACAWAEPCGGPQRRCAAPSPDASNASGVSPKLLLALPATLLSTDSKPRQDTRSWQSAVRRAGEFIFELTRKITARLSSAFSRRGYDFHCLFVSAYLAAERVSQDPGGGRPDLQSLRDACAWFGRMTIRRFKRNVSEMKQFAARDFEDVMQCVLPVMDGLFVDGGTTSTTPSCRMSASTFSPSMRTQSCICTRRRPYNSCATPSLPSESPCGDWRYRVDDQARKAFQSEHPEEPSHRALPDGIVRVGTTDSVSTQLVCSFFHYLFVSHDEQCEVSHRQPKIWYRTRTNRREVEQQIAANEHRIRVAQETEERMLAAEAGTRAPATDGRETLPEPEDDPLPDVPPRLHHQIGESTRSPWHLGHLPHLPGVPLTDDPF